MNPLTPPPLRDDCFALPAGVEWAPVDQAFALLRAQLHVVTEAGQVPLAGADGRILAQDVWAERSNPPSANTAVDGYGFAFESIGKGAKVLPLMAESAAAGAAFAGPVPAGHAVRILTGAALPEGIDTVVLQEDVSVGPGEIAFHNTLKVGANTRAAGEDVKQGELAVAAGARIGAAELALMAAVGVGEVSVRKQLRVAILSTGDELVEAGGEADAGQIYDANRPMLASMISRFGHTVVDMGRVPDDRAALATRMTEASGKADVILTSGGASSGDEDHVSALLEETSTLQLWRIAIKPGRPLALGLWEGTPVFGLPGNPVAAMVCTLIFARPAMALLAGAGWEEPLGFEVPAAFTKSKKGGRREYLRARIREGQAEVYASEGSGRIGGLSWADGLIELPDEACEIAQGDLVRFLPFPSFGL